MERKLFQKKQRAEGVIDEKALPDPLLRAWLGGEGISREKAMQIPALAGAINEIAETVANVPIKLYKRRKNRVEEVKGDRRTYLLNEDPGDTLDANMMKEALVRDYFLNGNGNLYVDWNGLEVNALRYVAAENVSVAGNADVIFKEYTILVQGKSYFPEQFVRILRNTKDGMNGLSVIEENRDVLSVSYNSLKFEENLVKTGGNKKGFLKSQRNLTKEAMDLLRNAWRRMYANNEENVVILNNGLEFQEASNTSVEMQLNENKKTNAQEIRTILGVPEDIGTEAGDKTFIKYCVNAFLNALMTALNKAMLLESEKGTYFFAGDTYELTKGDADKRYAAYKEAVETGWMQIDEVRERENMEPLGLNFVKMGLQDVLYDPKTKVVYTPNTNKSTKVGEMEREENPNDEEEEEIPGEREEEKRAARRNLLIVGAPGSGKSTYVKEIKKEGDMVIDFDSFRIALSGKSHQDIEDYELIGRIRRTSYKYLNEKRNKNRFLIISTAAKKEEIDRLAEYLHADVLEMPNTREKTIEQIMKDETRQDKQLFIDLANKWYDEHEGGGKDENRS